MNKLMDGYDVEYEGSRTAVEYRDPVYTVYTKPTCITYRVYRYERPKVGKPVKIYRFGYPDYKSMIQKHPELKVLQLT